MLLFLLAEKLEKDTERGGRRDEKWRLKIMYGTDIIGFFPIKLAVVALIIVISISAVRKSVKLFFEKTHFLDEKREQTLLHFIHQATNVIGWFIFAVYFFSHFFELTKLLTGSVVIAGALAIIFQHILRDYIMGFTYLFEKQIHHGDFVIINGNRQGTIEEISMRHLKIRQYDGCLYTVSYGTITELQNGTKEKRRVIEKMVLNYRQNPDDAFNIFEKVAEACNEKYADYLLKDQEGNPLEKFTFHEITALNVEFKGHEYSITALVNDSDFAEAGKKLRYELAIAAYQQDLKMAESNLYYRTRLNTTK